MKSLSFVLIPIILFGIMYPLSADAKGYNIYIGKMPEHWKSTFGNVLYDATEYWKKRIPGTEFYQVEQVRHADFVFQWGSQPIEIEDGKTRLGYYTTNTDNDFGKPYIQITLGYFEDGKWNLVDPDYALQITKHEIGHAIGFGHSNDPNDIMYPSIYNYQDWLLSKQQGGNFLDFVPSSSNIVSYQFETQAINLQEKVNSEIELLKNSIFSTEDTFYKTKVENAEAQVELDEAWESLSLAKEFLGKAEWTQKEGEEFIAALNYKNAYYKYDYSMQMTEQTWEHIIQINSHLHNAIQLEQFYQESEKTDQPPTQNEPEKGKFCFLFWCW